MQRSVAQVAQWILLGLAAIIVVLLVTNEEYRLNFLSGSGHRQGCPRRRHRHRDRPDLQGCRRHQLRQRGDRHVLRVLLRAAPTRRRLPRPAAAESARAHRRAGELVPRVGRLHRPPRLAHEDLGRSEHAGHPGRPAHPAVRVRVRSGPAFRDLPAPPRRRRCWRRWSRRSVSCCCSRQSWCVVSAALRRPSPSSTTPSRSSGSSPGVSGSRASSCSS